MGGDLDQNGAPVVPGLWYVAQGDPEDGATCVAGPFDRVEDAIIAAWNGPVPEAFSPADFRRAYRIAAAVMDSLPWVEVKERGQWEAPFLDGYVVCPASTSPALNIPNEEELFLNRCQSCGCRWPLDGDFEACPHCGR